MLNYGDALGYFFGPSSVTVDGCVHYSNEELNAQGALFTTARIIGAVCAASSYIIMLAICCIAPCVRLQPSRWKVLGGVLVFFGLCESFTIAGVFSSAVCRSCGGIAEGCESHCKMSLGGILAVLSSASWLISGAICCCIAPPTQKEDLTPAVYASGPVSVSVAPVAPITSARDNVDVAIDTPYQSERTGDNKSTSRSHHLHQHSHPTGSHTHQHRHHHHSSTNHSSSHHHKRAHKHSDSISL